MRRKKRKVMHVKTITFKADVQDYLKFKGKGYKTLYSGEGQITMFKPIKKMRY